MAKFRSITNYLLPLIATISISTALYEDQIGLFDWKRSFIGRVKHAKFDNKRLIVTTEENILASVNVKNGQVLWRQILEDPAQQQPQLLHVERDIITVTGAQNSFYVRSWDPNTGSMTSEWTLYTEQIAPSLWSVLDDELIHVVLVEGSHIEVTTYNARNGENRGATSKVSASWISSQCVLNYRYIGCLSNGKLHYTHIGESALMNSIPTAANAISNFSPGRIILHEANSASIFEVITAQVLPFKVENSATHLEDNRYVQLEVNDNPQKPIRIAVKDSETYVMSAELEYPLGLGAPYVIAARNTEVLLCSTDNALSLAQATDGKIRWTREEALSDIVTTEFFELPVSELDASIENEFKTSSGDAFSMLSHRLSTQAKQLFNLFFGSTLLANNGLVRDEFGLHKIIVVATSVGKLFAIDTLSGSIVWTYRLPNVESFDAGMMLLVQRTARFAPLPAQCLLVAKDSVTGNGVIFQFDPITGISHEGVHRLNYPIKQAMLSQYQDDDHLRAVIVVAKDHSIHVYPQNVAENVKKIETFMFTIEPKTSILQGYLLRSGMKKMWEVNLGINSKIVAISTRPENERMHSQGRVLPDRSVYYKYVNPNLIAIATLTPDEVHKQVLSVYLIDGVTGLILYSTSHRKAKGPIQLVHSENWLTYTFFNDRFRRTEIVAAELFEGPIQSNSTAFSSFAVSQLPHVQTQSYILSANPLSMSVTLTERGITNKFLLIALSTGSVIEVPWMLIQPRFQDIPCGPEESCIPYMPEIPLPPEATINYNQTLARVKDIRVAGARLESTSHVLVHGLDLFYTRVAPSKTFDVLKEDFDHKLIVLVLTGLILASAISKHLAAKKTLRQSWK